MAAWVNPIIKGALDYTDIRTQRENSVTVGDKAMKIITIEKTKNKEERQLTLEFTLFLFLSSSFTFFPCFVEFYASKCLTDWQKKPSS